MDEHQGAPQEVAEGADGSCLEQSVHVVNTDVWDTLSRYYPSFSGEEAWGPHATSLPRIGLQRPSESSNR